MRSLTNVFWPRCWSWILVCWGMLSLAGEQGGLPEGLGAEAGARSQQNQGIRWMESLSEAHQSATREQRLILVHFWSPSCGPCLQLERNVLSRNEVAEAVGQHYAAVKVDISKQPELAKYFQVRSIPTDVIVTAAGEEIHRQVSVQDPEQFTAMLRQHAAQRPQPLPLGLEGFCPVTLVEEYRWQEGEPRSDLEYQQMIYRFASPGHRDRFLQQPHRYAPAFSGLDVVQLREQGRTVMGKREHGVVFGEQYYLFTDEGALRRFWESPDRYAERPRGAVTYGAQTPSQTFSR